MEITQGIWRWWCFHSKLSYFNRCVHRTRDRVCMVPYHTGFFLLYMPTYLSLLPKLNPGIPSLFMRKTYNFLQRGFSLRTFPFHLPLLPLYKNPLVEGLFLAQIWHQFARPKTLSPSFCIITSIGTISYVRPYKFPFRLPFPLISHYPYYFRPCPYSPSLFLTTSRLPL